MEELRQLAAQRGVEPTALIRTWVLAQLDAARSSDDYPQRCERDVRTAADQLRKLLDERRLPPGTARCQRLRLVVKQVAADRR